MNELSPRRSQLELRSAHPLERRAPPLRSSSRLTAFLTVVDLFATQAILPSLASAITASRPPRWASPSTPAPWAWLWPALSSAISAAIDRRFGDPGSLVLLSIPTALLALQPDLSTFTVLRVVQGLCMSSAFTLTMAYLAEHANGDGAAGALAAYVTGNVASNLLGRLISAALTDHFGLAANFLVFAALNLAGAALVYRHARESSRHDGNRPRSARPVTTAWVEATLGSPTSPILRAATFGIGFLILFAFIGTFTYVNFVLVRAPLSLGPMSLGFVYFVFLPAIATTPLAGRVVKRFGTRPTFWASLARGRARPSASRPAEPPGGSARHGPGRGRHLLRPGLRHRASSAARRPPTGARRAASISRPISSAVWSAAPCSARSSICSAGRPASPASRSRS